MIDFFLSPSERLAIRHNKRFVLTSDQSDETSSNEDIELFSEKLKGTDFSEVYMSSLLAQTFHKKSRLEQEPKDPP
jgi:hypothetical protein